jgi:hypothetical protein
MPLLAAEAFDELTGNLSMRIPHRKFLLFKHSLESENQ